MRKLTAGLFHSVDGVVEAPYNFQFDSFDDELGAELGKVMGTTDSVILGRIGYEDWAGYWPTAQQDEGFASFINPVPSTSPRAPSGASSPGAIPPSSRAISKPLCAPSRRSPARISR